MRRSMIAGLVAVAGLAIPALAGPSSGDPLYTDQWGLHVIGALGAWPAGTGHQITIAVIDTGVDLDHPDLARKIVRGVDCVGTSGNPSQCAGSGDDIAGHGTHVAGIAAAVTGNGAGMAGTAPDAQIMAIRVFQGSGGDVSASAADVQAGIRWAVERGAHVINLSLGEDVTIRNLTGSDLKGAVEEAWRQGVVVAIAAGNEDFLFPSGYGDTSALVVTATDRNDAKASYATPVGGPTAPLGDAKWGMAAPGGDSDDGGSEGLIVSTWPDGQYAYAAGTSMAAPHVAGAAAVLRSLGLSPQQAVDRLLATARDLGDERLGAGRLDLAAAVGGLSPRPGPYVPPPSDAGNGSVDPLYEASDEAAGSRRGGAGGPGGGAQAGAEPGADGLEGVIVIGDDESIAAGGIPTARPQERKTTAPSTIVVLGSIASLLLLGVAGGLWSHRRPQHVLGRFDSA